MKNAKLDEMLEQGRRESDPAKRRAIYLADREARARRGAHRAARGRALGVGVSANVQGTKYNFNAYPVLSDAVLRK